ASRGATRSAYAAGLALPMPLAWSDDDSRYLLTGQGVRVTLAVKRCTPGEGRHGRDGLGTARREGREGRGGQRSAVGARRARRRRTTSGREQGAPRPRRPSAPSARGGAAPARGRRGAGRGRSPGTVSRDDVVREPTSPAAYPQGYDAGEVGMGRVTLQTIADKVGVSRMTVSNAFSRPDQLSAALREEILAAAAELGYVGPDPAARALARRSVGAVGVVLTDSLGDAFLDPVASAFFGALAAELAPTGLAVSLIPATAVAGQVPARDLALDAAVVYACAGESEAVEWLHRPRLPLVFVDQAPLPGRAGIVLDERSGGRLAVEHLVGLGHRDVVVFTTNSRRAAPGWAEDPHRAGSDHVSRERTAGAVEMLKAA